MGTTTDTDRGWKAIRDQIKKVRSGPSVSIGVQGTNASKAYPGGTSLLQVATANEFGTDRIPERSFIRATVDINREKYKALLGNLHARVLSRQLTVEQALGLLGQKIQADIINRINAGIDPENAPSTIDRKTKGQGGWVKPLIDTGQLKQAITYVVDVGR